MSIREVGLTFFTTARHAEARDDPSAICNVRVVSAVLYTTAVALSVFMDIDLTGIFIEAGPRLDFQEV